MTIEFTAEQQTRIDDIIKARVMRARKAADKELEEATRDLAFWKHRAAFYSGQVALLTEQNSRLTAMVGHPMTAPAGTASSPPNPRFTEQEGRGFHHHE